MNRDHARTSTALTRDHLSTNPHAVNERVRRLTDDDYAEKLKEAKKRYTGRRKVKEIEAKRNTRFIGFQRNHQAYLDRVRFHLSKGRDAADIAVREGWLMSKVNEAIKEIQK